ncbi:MAG: TraB/GumN family protein [Methylophilus sp.]|nr:TraB/GumN family protein [Methylophilus sp.]
MHILKSTNNMLYTCRRLARQWMLLFLLLGFTQLALATEKGIFWKLESPSGITSYLFGTMHTDDNRVTDFSPNVLHALNSVDLFMMEVQQSRDTSALMLKEGNLAQFLTDKEFEQVRALADFHVMHLGATLQMKPWLLAVIFDLPEPQTPFAQDNLLMTKSEGLLKDVEGIETSKEHFGIMDSFSMEEQMIMLRAVLKRSQEQKERDFEKLMSAYLAGDSDKITKLDEKITGGMLPNEIWKKMRQKLLDDRNVVMAERTIAAANQRPTFIAVGASHLSGDNGLIAAFKKAGFKLSPIRQ